jgi:predicted acetyltransferase
MVGNRENEPGSMAEIDRVPPEQTMSIKIDPASIFERPILRHLMELYQYDFSEFEGADIGPMGVYDYPYLDHYWVEPERHPFFVRVNENLAGFVLVARYNYLTGKKDTWVIAEFFIMSKYRHQGIGEYVACHIFDHFPGAWQVGQIYENPAATQFWRKVISRYTHGSYEEFDLDNDYWHGPVQAFNSNQT